MSSSIVNCKPSEKSIIKSIKRILNGKFKKNVRVMKRIYGDGNTSKKITRKLSTFNFEKYRKKIFYE